MRMEVLHSPGSVYKDGVDHPCLTQLCEAHHGLHRAVADLLEEAELQVLTRQLLDIIATFRYD